MSGLTFDHLPNLHLLWLVLLLAGVGVLGLRQRQLDLRRFADAGLLPRLTAATGWARALVRLTLVVAALLLLVGAAVGPRWGASTQRLVRRNIDVVVLLDVSRSMLARDIAPNRLERAKLAIRDDLLPALGGDRIGLVVFAGKTAVACPLTTDYGFFRLALDDVRVGSAPRGGTAIGDAIRRGVELFDQRLDTHRVLLLITDGEDHESFPVEAAAAAWKEHQVPIVALALGDPEQGARIPTADNSKDYLQYGGETVWSRADFSQLERVAHASPDGVFVPVGTSNFDLGEIYSRIAGALRFTEQTDTEYTRQPERGHWFAFGALVCVLLEALLPDRTRRGARPEVAP